MHVSIVLNIQQKCIWSRVPVCTRGDQQDPPKILPARRKSSFKICRKMGLQKSHLFLSLKWVKLLKKIISLPNLLTVILKRTETAGEPKPDTTLGSFLHLQPSVEDSFIDSPDQSDCNWAQTNEVQSDVEDLKNSEAPESNTECPVKEQPFPCSYCGKIFSLTGNLN